LRLIVALAAALLALVQCSESATARRCQQACARLNACGLLPSPLGGGLDSQDNCQSRCQESDQPSDSNLQSAVLDCVLPSESGTGIGDFGRSWCGAPLDATTEANDGLCAQVAACLSRTNPSGSILGQSSLTVLVAGNADGGSPLPTAEGPGCATSCCDAAQETPTDPSWCLAVGARSIQAFVVQESNATLGATQTCAAALTNPTLFPGLTPGLARPGLYVAGQTVAPAPPDGGDADAEAGVGSSAYCWVFWGEQVVTRAGATTEAVVDIVPSQILVDGGWARTCERGAACHDGIDNDGDGLIDCADPKCEVECSEDAGSVDASIGAKNDAEAGVPDGSVDSGSD
jgi:hypothetical protein